MIVIVLLAFGVLVLLPVLPMLSRTHGVLGTVARCVAAFGFAFFLCALAVPGDAMTRTGLALYAAMIEALCVALAAVIANFAESRARAAELRADR